MTRRRASLLTALGIAMGLAAFAEGTSLEPERALTGLTWQVPSRYARLEGNILTVDIPASAYPATAMASARIPSEFFRGADCLTFRLAATGKDVRTPTASYLGLKIQPHWSSRKAARQEWPNIALRTGDFALRPGKVTADFNGIEPDEVVLQLGLQETSGKVTFDLSTLTCRRNEHKFPKVNQDKRVAYPPSVTDDIPRRGVMLPATTPTRDDFATLRKWGATLARYQMIRGWNNRNDNQDTAEYWQWLNGRLDALEKTVMPLAREFGLKLVIDVHVPPGGRAESGEMNMFRERTFADFFVACWRKIARRFKGNTDVIYGYDLINEPHQIDDSTFGYWDLQREAALAVRAIDPETPIIIESNGWDSPGTFGYLSPLEIDNVIYQVHMYLPFDFTHQGVLTKKTGVVYPDEAKGWNIDYVRKQLDPVKRFAERHNAKIYVGEFSAAVWAPGAEKFLADCISVFNSYGWDWTYHAFREWAGWSVEHTGTDKNHLVPAADTPRKRVLIEGFRAPVKRP